VISAIATNFAALCPGVTKKRDIFSLHRTSAQWQTIKPPAEIHVCVAKLLEEEWKFLDEPWPTLSKDEKISPDRDEADPKSTADEKSVDEETWCDSRVLLPVGHMEQISFPRTVPSNRQRNNISVLFCGRSYNGFYVAVYATDIVL